MLDTRLGLLTLIKCSYCKYNVIVFLLYILNSESKSHFGQHARYPGKGITSLISKWVSLIETLFPSQETSLRMELTQPLSYPTHSPTLSSPLNGGEIGAKPDISARFVKEVVESIDNRVSVFFGRGSLDKAPDECLRCRVRLKVVVDSE